MTKRFHIVQAVVCALSAVAAFAGHEIVLDEPIAVAEEGLIIGNGDLSCSIYQDGDETVFRLGKGDVWDRRIDYSTSPKPPTHDEGDGQGKSQTRRGASDRGRQHHVGLAVSVSEADGRAAA